MFIVNESSYVVLGIINLTARPSWLLYKVQCPFISASAGPLVMRLTVSSALASHASNGGLQFQLLSSLLVSGTAVRMIRAPLLYGVLRRFSTYSLVISFRSRTSPHNDITPRLVKQEDTTKRLVCEDIHKCLFLCKQSRFYLAILNTLPYDYV